MMVRTIGARRSRGLAQFAAGLALVAAGLVLDGAAPARAEGPWCASVTGPDGGYVLCNYASWDQCVATLRGIGGICHPNPDPAFSSVRPVRKRRG